MSETIPVTDKVLLAEPAPGNQAIQIDTEPGTPPTTSQEEKDAQVFSENHYRISQKVEEMLTKMGSMIEIEPHCWVTKPADQ
ncbi:MAG: hypothetical protein WCH01_13955 [Methylococcaceae bacterium]